MKKLSLFFIVALVSCCGVHAATISVPSATTTVQAAINLAIPGDVIEITDGATYNEDCHIPLGLDNLTIRGVGAKPTILASNTVGRTIATKIVYVVTSGLAPVGSPDSFGFFIEGNGATLENLILQNDGPDPITGGDLFTSACNVVGDDATFINVDFLGGTIGDNEFGIGDLCGDWPLLDAAVAAAGLGGGFAGGMAAEGYTTPTSADRAHLIDCTIPRGSNLFGVGDYTVFIISEAVDEFIPANNGIDWVLDNCVLTGIDDQEIMEAAGLENVVFNNCTIQGDTAGAVGSDEFQIGGGTWTFNSCLFRDAFDGELMHLESIVEFGGGSANVYCNDTVFCGATTSAGIIQVAEGNLTLNRCIFNVQDLDGASALDLDVDDFSGDFVDVPMPGAFFGAFGSTQSGIPHPATHGVIIDQCDFYVPNGGAVALRIDPAIDFEVAEPDTTITVTNSIIVSSGDGISAGTVANGAGTLNVSNCSIHSLGGAQITGGDWTVNQSAILDELPGYLDPLSCPNPAAADFYLYTNQTLATAGDSGQFIGSQGPSAIASDVADWTLYN